MKLFIIYVQPEWKLPEKWHDNTGFAHSAAINEGFLHGDLMQGI